jgi:hypothetical protein
LLWLFSAPTEFMRENASKILALMFVSLLAPAASARPHKQVAKTEAVAFQKPGKKAAVARAQPVRTKTKHERATVQAAPNRVGRHGRAAASAHERVAANRQPAHGKPLLRASREVRRQATPADPRAVTRVERPQPAESNPEPETIHVTHDRKQHMTAPSTDSTPEAAVTGGSDFDADALVALPELSSTSKSGKVAAPVAKAIAVASLSRRPVEKPWAPAVEELVPQLNPMPALYSKRGRLIVPPALKGSHEILVHQNQMADRDGLVRIQDDVDLDRLRDSKSLVAIPSIPGIQTDERLPVNRRYCRPWTAQFLTALARAHYAKFHTPLQVNSAVRTVAFQQKLLRTNGNAAPAGGETASPHLTGQAIDLAKHGLSMTEIAWLRGYLLPLVQQGKVDVEEEFQQSCFHISVYKKYVPQPTENRNIAADHRSVGATLAVAIP